MTSHLFADDTQIYKMLAAVNSHHSVEQINKVLAVNGWAIQNKLVINAGKGRKRKHQCSGWYTVHTCLIKVYRLRKISRV